MSFDNFPTLQERLWKEPDHYVGAQWDGEAVIAMIHRDSGLLDQSNWDTLLKLVGGESEHVHIERARHWGVGWVDTMLMRPTAPDELKKEAEDALNALSDYPVLDEEDHSRREWEAAEEYWKRDGEYVISGYNEYYKTTVSKDVAELTLSELHEQYPDLYQYAYDIARE